MLIIDVMKYIRLKHWYRLSFVSQRVRSLAMHDHDGRELRECNHLLILIQLLADNKYGKWNTTIIIANPIMKWKHFAILNYFRKSGSGIPTVYDPDDPFFDILFMRESMDVIEKWIPEIRNCSHQRMSPALLISGNPQLTIKFVRTYPDIIDWFTASGNKAISIRDIKDNRDLPWHWATVSDRDDIDWDIVLQHPDYDWIWSELSRNVPMPVVLTSRHLNWNPAYMWSNPELTHRAAIELGVDKTHHLFAYIPLSVLKAEGLYDPDKTSREYFKIRIFYCGGNLIDKYPNANWNDLYMYRHECPGFITHVCEL